MNEFSAAIGLEQLKKIYNLNDKRRKIAKRYHSEIKFEEKMPTTKNVLITCIGFELKTEMSL